MQTCMTWGVGGGVFHVFSYCHIIQEFLSNSVQAMCILVQ